MLGGVDMQIFWKNYAISLYDWHGHALVQEPYPRGHDIYNFGTPFLYYLISLSDLCLGVEKKKNINITFFFYILSVTKQVPVDLFTNL